MNRLSAFFYRISTGWVALAALIVFLVFSVLTLPAETQRTEQYSQGLGSPDTSLFYNSDQLLKMAGTFGEEGRAAFIKARWSFDLAFPFIYSFFYLTAISFLFNKLVKPGSWWRIFNLIPILGLVFDLAENSATTSVMAVYPRLNPTALFLAPIFTPLKWFFVAFGTVLLVGLVLYWGIRGFIIRPEKTI